MSQVLSVAAPPLSLALIPLAIAIGEVVKASRHARGNKVEAEMLAQRVQDCGAKMTEVVAAVKEQPHQAKAVTTSVERLTQVIKECTNCRLGLHNKSAAVCNATLGFHSIELLLQTSSSGLCRRPPVSGSTPTKS